LRACLPAPTLSARLLASTSASLLERALSFARVAAAHPTASKRGVCGPAAADVVALSSLTSAVVPTVCGLSVLNVGRVGDGCERGGTAAPAARNLVVVALAARDIVVIDAGVVRLPSTSSSPTPAAAVTVLGRRHPQFVTLSLSTMAVSATVVVVVG
jgi:hypothetical protein